MEEFFQKLALVMSIILPLWNVPLIVTVIRRKSSQDISMSWAWGVWGCFVLMLPSALMSDEFTWKAFNLLNVISFTVVVIVVMMYHQGRSKNNS